MENKQGRLHAVATILFLIPLLVWSQKRTAYTEFGGGFGTLNQNSDIALNESTEGVFDEIRIQGFIHAKRHLNDWFGVGVNLKLGYTEAFDANHGNSNRGFETEALLMQSNLFFELHLRKFGKYRRERDFTYYLKGGVGFTAWDPTLKTSNNREFPDNIVPQNDSYNGSNILLGGGFKYRISYQSIIGLEFTSHFLGEDNLDGFISEAGGGNDGFGGVSIYYSYLLF